MQAALDSVAGYLASISLEVSSEKNNYVVFPGERRKAPSVSLSIGSHLIQRAKVQRFLGINLDDKCTWVPQVRASLSAITGPANALRRHNGTSWESSTLELLHRHSSLVICKLVYALPYYEPSSIQERRPDIAHHAGIKQALRVPDFPSTRKVYAETAAFLIRGVATSRSLVQLIRTHQ